MRQTGDLSDQCVTVTHCVDLNTLIWHVDTGICLIATVQNDRPISCLLIGHWHFLKSTSAVLYLRK